MKLSCFLLGHKWRKLAYSSPWTDVYVCERCGKMIFKARSLRRY
ncbi:MAG: DUF1660 domain-containing protein [Ruminococcus sp.]|nr:DUF1660 domain-containing protein [Ruminococcus sp.]